ncbi:Uncharacterised protein [Legionella wadsworthii]|uniref:N-acetyltransferase domain-containing protein n=1 Tax=Legionella wadsworthii TaxID=28088 RepID=A0A378LQF4_9GAMM|nr:hypothetical protein [Legionella wadsworthii]STY28937.1 Uncharacterised protein [Legionella wadsworthii]
MALDVIHCEKSKHFRDFLNVPFLLHKNNKNWVPPLKVITKHILHKKNPFHQNADMSLWIAYRHNKPVGRIACIINKTHNHFYNENVAFWGFFESENNHEITTALFNTIEEWSLNQKISKIRGPMNPSINYECGLQISAFDTKPYFMMPQNPEYYISLIENQGYNKIQDLQAWNINVQQAKIEPRKIQTLKTLQKKYDIHIRLANKKHFAKELELISKIYNDAWQDNWGYLPLDFKEFDYLISDLKSILDPNLIYIAEIAGEPCGFSVGVPDINQLLLNNRNGKLLSLKLLKLIWQIKVSKSINQFRIPLLGVLKKYKHLPIGAILYYEYFKRITPESQFFGAECSWILESNHAMQAGLRLVNATHYKSYRIYEKNFLKMDNN